MISLTDIAKHFDTPAGRITALEDVTLDIGRGEIFGVIGYSGAGKSTLIRLLNGLERPSAGRVRVGAFELTGAGEAALRRARLKIGMIFQHFNLLWSRTVAGNIALPLQIAGTPRAAIGPRVAELIRLVGLEGREEAYPAQLSGGQKQRVGIARALATEPEVLLCDEATSALDPETTDQILDLLSAINARLGLTIVLITHEMHVVRRICDRVAVMEAGRIVEEGPVAEVFARPRAEITRRFLRQLPDEAGEREGRVLRLVYAGATAGEPVLAEAIQRFGLPVTILAARMNRLASGDLGELTIRVEGEAEPFLAHLRERGVEVQEATRAGPAGGAPATPAPTGPAAGGPVPAASVPAGAAPPPADPGHGHPTPPGRDPQGRHPAGPGMAPPAGTPRPDDHPPGAGAVPARTAGGTDPGSGDAGKGEGR